MYARIGTYYRLGLLNILRVAMHRLRFKVARQSKAIYKPHSRYAESTADKEVFFVGGIASSNALTVSDHWQGTHSYFSRHFFRTNEVPNWHVNVFSSRSINKNFCPWWKIVDTDNPVGDIKVVWESSRMDWVLCFAQQHCSGTSGALDKLNNWLADWWNNNPPYSGPNWMCAQEASIRVIHLAVAALILQQQQTPTSTLLQTIRAHMVRIADTIQYAIAQDNNHATSEAAALYIGGSWLSDQGNPEGLKWQKLGERWLENRARHLIELDGSFSQRSTTYHRLMLDTYSVAEIWRRRLDLTEFSEALYSRLSAATDWLQSLVVGSEGDVPNLGANDGALLLPLGKYDYRDFRPSVALAANLFQKKVLYEKSSQCLCDWLGLPAPPNTTEAAEVANEPKFRSMPNGGYQLMYNDEFFALFVTPKFKFRPSQADALHIDLWHKGKNLLCDGGSYSYTDELGDLLKSCAAHNTIEFDGKDQMPKLSRFLYTDWLKMSELVPARVKGNSVTAMAACHLKNGGEHKRSVTLFSHSLIVVDQVSEFGEKAVLRWRLAPARWILNGEELVSELGHLSIVSNEAISRCELVESWTSLYYLDKQYSQTLEIEIRSPGEIKTTFSAL